jgi:hypothetical protein
MNENSRQTMDRQPPARWKEILVVFVICFAATLAIRSRTLLFGPSSPQWNEPIDHFKYEYVAEHPLGSFHIQPTCWRIGVPLLVRLLPFSTYRSFDLLGILFLGLTGGLIYLWLLAIPRPRDEAILGVIMFYALGPAVKLLLFSVESPDPASYFFIVLALYAIYRENDWLCACALAAGMFTKETLIIVVPLHYTLKAKGLWDLPRLKRTAWVALPAICVFIGIRTYIPAWNNRPDYVQSLPFIYTQVSAGDVDYTLKNGFLGVLRTYRDISPINLLRLFTWGSLGLHLFAPFFSLRKNGNVFLRWAPYWLVVLGTLLMALNADRRLGSLFPVLIVAGLNGIGALADRLGASISDFQIVFLIQFLLVLLKKDVYVVPFDLGAAAFVASLCWLVAKSGRMRERTAAPVLIRE